MDLEACIFKFKYSCDDTLPCSQNKGPRRIHSIIAASKLYKDYLHVSLEEQLSFDEKCTVCFHRNCVSQYMSTTNTKYAKHSTKTLSEDSYRSPKCLRKSAPSFDFLSHCLYCGEAYVLKNDPKNPGRWRPSYLCHPTESKINDKLKQYKESILNRCEERDDEWAHDVRRRINRAISGLHAAEARYHANCMNRFLVAIVELVGKIYKKWKSCNR